MKAAPDEQETIMLGRPRYDDNVRRVAVNIAMDPVLVKAIDAANNGYSRSEFIERMIIRALSE